MIQKAEEARDQSKKVKNMADCMITENSWRLSENFERNCKERIHRRSAAALLWKKLRGAC